MQVVTSTDFATHQDKYFDMAIDRDICVKRGQNLFQIVYQPVVEEPIIFEPDEDFYRSITAEQLLVGVHEDINCFFDSIGK
jgi:hypothetical protein